MDISPRKSSLNRSPEPVDDWLHNQGYFRKHVPRDSTCLFRAFAEQVYSTQHYHIRVRRECVDFMRKNCHLFEQNYLEQMSCFTEWGGPQEIKAMSLLYKKEVFIFDGFTMIAKSATDNGFQDTLYLCHTPQKQYESVYPKEFITTAGYCQSLVYQTLYKEVFKMSNIEETVQKMLHDRSANLRHDRFFLKDNLEIRDKLSTELLSKIERGSETSEEEKSIARGITPFPYKVAKALDPNIYRNTDFDIWHELRREVRNSGWTKWNSTKLQVGGKCRVQIDYKDEELDKTNNNFELSSLERECISSKDPKKLLNKREHTLLYGHIQEMSKDEGPVIVFIEELGEKRTVPFAALKPIVPRRNKQNNWSPNNSRKNSTYDPTQKWKKTWNSNRRKSKESSPNYRLNNPVDRNNNTNDIKTDNKTEDTDIVEAWDDDSSDKKNELNNYTMETYNSCQGFTVESTIDVRPVTVLLDNVQSTLRSSPSLTHNIDEYSMKNSSQLAKNPTCNDNNPDRGSPNVGSLPPDAVTQPFQQISVQSPSEPFYPLPNSGMQPIFPANQNMMCATLDGNVYPLPFPCFMDETSASGNPLDRTTRAINFSVPASLDVNGSDLPFSDTVTLRFFYNLGLEYFRSTHTWGYGSNRQAPLHLPSSFVPQGNFVALNPSNESTQQQGSMANEDENLRSGNGPRQNYAVPRRRNDNSSTVAKFHNAQQQQQQSTKTFSNRKNDAADFTNVQKINDIGGKSTLETQRSQTYMNNDKIKDHSNARKNPNTSRYKKNIDSRNRNSFPPNAYQQENHHNPPIYQLNSSSIPQLPVYHGTKNSDGNQQGGNQANWKASSVPTQSASGNQQANYQTPYGGPQPIYASMPYFPNEGDGFYPHGPGFYPIPFVPAHSEIVDGNPVNSYASQAYPSIPEVYPQPISTVFPPYLYPPQTIFSGLPNQQNPQDNWFPLSGQAPYVQYPQIQNSQSPSNVNVPNPSP